MENENLENTEVVAEDSSENTVVESEKPKAKKTSTKNNKSGVISSNQVEDDGEETIDQLLDKLIQDEVSKGNIIGSMAADIKDRVAVDAEATKVAVFSSRNASWSGYGSVYKGYNILSKRRADAWLTRGHVRVATPAEIAQNLR